MSIKHTINKNLFRAYTRVKYPIPAWKFLNKKNISAFNKNVPTLSPVQEKILSDLRETGIAVTSLESLFPGENKLETFKKVIDQRDTSGSVNHKKKFLVDYWDECVELTNENPFLHTALSPVILDVVNSYMEMYTSLLYFTLQKTIPSHGELTNSQNWHRDPQEQKIVKVFIYLNDVDDTAGPFTYVKKSAPTGNQSYSKLFPQQPPEGSYPGNKKVVSVIDKDDITPMTGKAGTIIFCDTNGLHYGGVATANPRIMSTFGYPAHTFKDNQTYHYNESFLSSIESLPEQSQRAIRPQWQRN